MPDNRDNSNPSRFQNGFQKLFEAAGANLDERRISKLASLIATVILILSLSMVGLAPSIFERFLDRPSSDLEMQSALPNGNAHLGAEYYNIAASLVNGRGYSDPFIVRSGPTAWMPPLLVWLNASLIWLFNGDRFLVMLAIVFLKSMVLCASGIAVVLQGCRTNREWLAFLVMAIFLIGDFTDCFLFTHDGWLILAGVMATVFGLAVLERVAQTDQLTLRRAGSWGFLGGVLALASPVAGFTWAAGTTKTLLIRSPRALFVSALVSIVVILPWTIRNKVVFNKIIPIKSNAFFELDQSLVVDDDGLVDYQTMSKHPYHAGIEQDRYVEMGEMAYLKSKRERFIDRFREEPAEFGGRVVNRLIGATLWPAGFSAFHSTLRWAVYPWPAIAVVFLMIYARPLSPLQRSALFVYIVFLTPYILCSYYPRYGFPLIFVKVLVCFWALELLTGTKRKRRSVQKAATTQCT